MDRHCHRRGHHDHHLVAAAWRAARLGQRRRRKDRPRAPIRSQPAVGLSDEERQGYAARLVAIDERVKQIVAELKKRGFRSPYLRNYVVARINPVRFHRAKKGDTTPPMAMGAALTRMAASARGFDVAAVREQDLALVAAMSSE